MNVPANLLYTNDHEWVRVEGEFGYVGVTDFAQNELGDIVFIEINSVGKSLEQNTVFGTIEAVKTVSDLFLPIAAEIVEKNAKLDSNPELVNSDPYGEGWMVKIKFTGTPNLDSLIKPEAYTSMIGA